MLLVGGVAACTHDGSTGRSDTDSGRAHTIAVGVQTSGSGAVAPTGQAVRNGVALALAQAGPEAVSGYRLIVREVDDGGSAAGATTAATTLVRDGDVAAVIGPTTTVSAAAAASVYGAAGLSVLGLTGGTDELGDRFDTFHRVVATDAVEGAAIGRWLAKKSTRVFILDDTTADGIALADVVAEALAAADAVTVRQGVAATPAALAAAAQAVVASAAPALFYSGPARSAAILAKALAAAKFTGTMLAGRAALDASFAADAGAAGNGWYFACGGLDVTAADPAGPAAAFVRAYQGAYGTLPTRLAAKAYDAANALIAAFRSAARAGVPTRAAVSSALADLSYQGVTGTVSFAADGELRTPVINLYQQRAGRLELIGDIARN